MRRTDQSAQSDQLEQLNITLSGKIQSLERALTERLDALQQILVTEIPRVASANTQTTESLEILRQQFDSQSPVIAQISTSSDRLLQMSTELSSKESTIENALLGRMQELQQALVDEIQKQHSLLKISHISASLETLQQKFEEQSTTISSIPSLLEMVQRLQGQVEKLHSSLSMRLPVPASDGRLSLDTLRQMRDQRMVNAANAIREYRQSDEALQQATEETTRTFEDLYQKLMLSVQSIAPDTVRQKFEPPALSQGTVVEVASSDQAGVDTH